MIAITMGDPGGIGPEIAIKGFAPLPRRVHIGDPRVYIITAEHLRYSLNLAVVSSPEEAAALPADRFAVLPTVAPVTMAVRSFGRANPEYAAATVESIQKACQLAMAGQVKAVVTPPINKAVCHAAGFDFPGHTELLAQCAKVHQPVMMLAGGGLRVVPATIHQAICTVSHSLRPDFLESILRTTWNALGQDFGIRVPRIAVAGLNPHAGEDGAFGKEEREIIVPVCEKLRKLEGYNLIGPLPADSLFHSEARKTFDVAVCMYHDQALIPLKMLAFGSAVNITLGLPIVRTSVDHGTAYDIAGLGVANHRSYFNAVKMAEMIAESRGKKI